MRKIGKIIQWQVIASMIVGALLCRWLLPMAPPAGDNTPASPVPASSASFSVPVPTAVPQPVVVPVQGEWRPRHGNAPLAVSPRENSPQVVAQATGADGWRRRVGADGLVQAVFQQPAGPEPGSYLPEPGAVSRQASPPVPQSRDSEWRALTPRPPAPAADPTLHEPRRLPDPKIVPPVAADGPKLPAPRMLPPDKEPAPGDDPGTERAILLGAARTAVQLGKLDLAIRRFEEYLASFPDDLPVRREYAGILIQAGQTRKAVDQYRDLVAKQPDSVELRVAYADMLVIAKEFCEAIKQLQRALELAPKDPEVATKLARAYTFDSQLTKASQIYDQYLARIQPGGEDATPTLAALLLDLQRPADALAFLLPLQEKKPENREILTLLVRTYARLGDHKAIETAEEIARRYPDAINDRLTLAGDLYAASDYEMAGLVYSQVLATEPANVRALIGTARVDLQLYAPELARKILLSVKPTETTQRDYLGARAEYHQAVGEYTEAKQIYRDLLCRNPCDQEARLALAALLEFSGELDKAKAEYGKIAGQSATGRRARLGIASVLATQRFFAKSMDVCQLLLTEDPGDSGAMAQLVRDLGKVGNCDKAAALARGFLVLNSRNDAAVLAVGLALGKVLVDSGACAEAAHEYEYLLERPTGRVAAVYYGLARALNKLGDHDKAHQALAAVTCLTGGDARNRILLADLFYADYDDAATVDMLQGVLKFDPENLAALIRLADAQGRQARMSGHIQEVAATAKTILALSPTNVRGRLALARALATCEDYKGSVAEYDHLIALDHDFHLAQRERARVLYSAHEFELAAAAYHQMQVPSADERLQHELAGLLQRDPRAALLAPCVRAELSGPELQAELAKLADIDPDLKASLNCLFLDYEACATEQNAARLEGDAKCKKGWRDFEAIPIYKQLLAVEPANEEALFDLGQVYGTLKETRHALDTFGELLKVDPVHREASIASERASLELDPQARFGFSYFNQKGFDNLAVISRVRIGSTILCPYGDEDEYVSASFSGASYKPQDDRALEGNIFSLRGQKKYDEQLLLFGQANFEEYQNRLHDRITYDAGAQWTVNDLLRVRADTFLENVEENGETLRQDIHRMGLNAGADVRPTRLWDFGANYRFAYYSDHNDLSEIYAYNEVSLSLPPKQLKLVVDVDYMTFSEQTVLATPNPNIIVGATHPYFSPAGFAYYEGRIEWYQWLSRDYFVYGDQCWYSLQYALGWDSNINNYNTVRAVANWDVKPWLSVGADGKAMFSQVYKMQEASAYLVLRFPCRLW